MHKRHKRNFSIGIRLPLSLANMVKRMAWEQGRTFNNMLTHLLVHGMGAIRKNEKLMQKNHKLLLELKVLLLQHRTMVEQGKGEQLKIEGV